MKSNVIIKRLSIGVASTDQSYMPMLVAVLVGRDVNDLHEIKETKIPAYVFTFCTVFAAFNLFTIQMTVLVAIISLTVMKVMMLLVNYIC